MSEILLTALLASTSVGAIASICCLLYIMAKDRRSTTAPIKKREKPRRYKAVLKKSMSDEKILKAINEYGGKWK